MAVPILTHPLKSRQSFSKDLIPAQKSYLAMYSTWWGGIVKEPGLMMVPVDDHIVHRGDGVFEAIKVLEGSAFLLQEHLERLEASAHQLGIALPLSLEEIKNIIIATTTSTGSEKTRFYAFIFPADLGASPQIPMIPLPRKCI